MIGKRIIHKAGDARAQRRMRGARVLLLEKVRSIRNGSRWAFSI